MSKQQNAYPLRLDEVSSTKIKYLAEQYERSFNGQISWMLKQWLADYERENGDILVTAKEGT